ncbi:MAG TPA: AtpZ/AtpI family protein [Candidatus Didemnitutus sp.]|nr:AtpZ/AtpI family protein [Candidatus Didemnitutus sp.]
MQSTDSAMRQAAPYLLLGTQMAATVIVLGGIGWWIDSIASTDPLILVIGLSVGSVVGLVQFLRSVHRLGEEDKQRKRDQQEQE